MRLLQGFEFSWCCLCVAVVGATPSTRCAHTLTPTNSSMWDFYLFGGWDGKSMLNDMHVLNAGSSTERRCVDFGDFTVVSMQIALLCDRLFCCMYYIDCTTNIVVFRSSLFDVQNRWPGRKFFTPVRRRMCAVATRRVASMEGCLFSVAAAAHRTRTICMCLTLVSCARCIFWIFLIELLLSHGCFLSNCKCSKLFFAVGAELRSHTSVQRPTSDESMGSDIGGGHCTVISFEAYCDVCSTQYVRSVWRRRFARVQRRSRIRCRSDTERIVVAVVSTIVLHSISSNRLWSTLVTRTWKEERTTGERPSAR